MKQTIYDFTVRNVEGEPVPLSDFRGKVLLIVNTATECGFTPQLRGLQQLYEQYRDRGFEILAFPSNDFKNQEPREGEEIRQFCETRYRTTFPLFEKIHVRGPETAELYRYLGDKSRNGHTSAKPRWNFHKYLVNRQGRVVRFFYPFTKPTARRVRKALEKALAEPA